MYNIEIKLAAKSGYYTPAESRTHYGRYSRDGVAIHWWGDGTGASNHDNIVNYILNKAKAGTGSANYVVSDAKITLLVNPDDVAWCTFEANSYTISVEIQPTLGAEGYKKMGWLIWQLRERYNKNLWLRGHKALVPNRPTACPGTLSIDRMEQEAQKWASGGYNPAPAKPEWLANQKAFLGVKKMYTLKDAPLYNLETNAVIKRYAVDTPMDIAAETMVKGTRYLQTKYSLDNKQPNGFSSVSLVDSPTPPPPPPEPVKPEWEKNLVDIDATNYYLVEAYPLIDITKNSPASPAKSFTKGELFVGSAKTRANGTDYAITEYSYAKKIFNGLPLSKLSVTPPTPTQPEVPPVPPTPTNPNQGIIDALLDIISKLWDIIKKLGG